AVVALQPRVRPGRGLGSCRPLCLGAGGSWGQIGLWLGGRCWEWPCGLFRIRVSARLRAGSGSVPGLTQHGSPGLGHRSNTSSLCKYVCIANLLLMTTGTAYPADDPRRLLSSTRELALRVRKAQRATWFPLLVFAAVTLASIPVYRYGGHHLICVAVPGDGPHGAPGRVCTVYSNARFVYWPIALVLAYVAIAAFYIRRSR